MLRLLLCDYQLDARYYTIYIGLSKASRLTTLRLFHDYLSGKTTTIGYDYSSRDAATIARPYWLSGESPKKRYGGSRQWFRAARRALLLGYPAGWRVPDHNPPGLYGLRCAALSGMDP